MTKLNIKIEKYKTNDFFIRDSNEKITLKLCERAFVNAAIYMQNTFLLTNKLLICPTVLEPTTVDILLPILI